uniref:Uncharacterized protein n=1 Tax=Anguilla anguilla TaxID=7936 RepID=A0A0E9SMW7_ANGAN
MEQNLMNNSFTSTTYPYRSVIYNKNGNMSSCHMHETGEKQTKTPALTQ